MSDRQFFKLEAPGGETLVLTRQEVIKLLNQDHGEGWDTYDETSTLKEVKEGINFFTLYTFIGLV